MGDFDLDGYLHRHRAEVELALDRFLPSEEDPPPLLHRAMRYAVFAGGKRLRPVLVLAGHDALGGSGSASAAMEFACAVECIHTYSLVHDDLPALDDDDLRRGRATVHKAFDEATAILVGDALLTVAFETALGGRAAPPGGLEHADASERSAAAGREFSDASGHPVAAGWPARARGEDIVPPARRLEALRLLASAIGTSGMIGGQVDDLLATHERPDETRVRSIHERKTGALLRACPLVGGILAGADDAALARLGAYGADLGLAFQIVDDILDIEETSLALGKTAGKDEAAGKATFPAAVGVARSRAIAEQLAQRAEAAATALGPSGEPLAALARYVIRRRK